MNHPSCWICGGIADSAEHMVKASDFRSEFGKVTQSAAVFRHSKIAHNVPVKGANAGSIKFRPSLCSYCNNTRTQPYDRAWEKLSATVRHHNPLLKRGAILPLVQAFPGDAKQEMLNVHLYFLKLFGCYAVEYNVPLPVSTLSVALLGGHPHPNVYLDFVAILSNAGKSEVMVGDINAVNREAVTVGATWFYIVGTFGVHLTYFESGHPRMTRRLGLHPEDVGLQLRIR